MNLIKIKYYTYRKYTKNKGFVLIVYNKIKTEAQLQLLIKSAKIGKAVNE